MRTAQRRAWKRICRVATPVLIGVVLAVLAAPQNTAAQGAAMPGCVPRSSDRTKVTFFELAFETIQSSYFRPACEAELVDGCARGLRAYAPASGYTSAIDAAKTKADVVALLERFRVEKVGDLDGPSAACIGGMAAVLDGRSSFRDAGAVERMFVNSLRAEWGFDVVADPDGGRVAAVAAGSPAARAGLAVDDVITEIDGNAVRGNETMVLARRILRFGAPRLTVRRPGSARASRVTLEPAPIKQRLPVARLFDGGLGYLRVPVIEAATAAQLVDALRDLRWENGSKLPAGLVLDLREASGGPFEAVNALAAMFLAPDSIAFVVERKPALDATWSRERNRTYRTVPDDYKAKNERDPLARLDPATRGVPLVVLTGQRMGSGAELLAASLRAHGRARLAGAPSPGVQMMIAFDPIHDSFGALMLTSARLSVPGGADWDANGLQPDVVVEPAVDRPAGEIDATLKAALELLR